MSKYHNAPEKFGKFGIFSIDAQKKGYKWAPLSSSFIVTLRDIYRYPCKRLEDLPDNQNKKRHFVRRFVDLFEPRPAVLEIYLHRPH